MEDLRHIEKLIEWHSELPDIDRQIEFVKFVRREFFEKVSHLKKELVMTFAIEQSLIAAKLLSLERDDSRRNPAPRTSELQALTILLTFQVPVTSIRLAIVDSIIRNFGDDTFSLPDFYQVVDMERKISQSSIKGTFNLFTTRKVLLKEKTKVAGTSSRQSYRLNVVNILKDRQD